MYAQLSPENGDLVDEVGEISACRITPLWASLTRIVAAYAVSSATFPERVTHVIELIEGGGRSDQC
jgi:hypothetical protein